MSYNNLRVLLIIEQCNPELPSVPQLGYHFFQELDKRVFVTLCTHGRNENNLRKVHSSDNIVFCHESRFLNRYYRFISRLLNKMGANWPLSHTLFYPLYAEFNRQAFRLFKDKIAQGEYDIVHAFTPIIPRYPVKLINSCHSTPFIFGPVNGGIPFPKGFSDIERREFGNFNFLRNLCSILPNYRKTYIKADKVLAGSTYTLNMLQRMFSLSDDRIELFCENGVPSNFFASSDKNKTNKSKFELLFVGRLVPFKGIDLLIHALSRLDKELKEKARLTIVGEGTERKRLEQLSLELGINHLVTFTGFVNHKSIISYYKQSDLFCFPSVREFGGAVVLEAMAAGLPCIVVDYGGIGEYVTEQTGFKIKPESKQYIINMLGEKIKLLIENSSLCNSMEEKGKERAMQFEWGNKIEKLLTIYDEVLKYKKC